jgi:VanZ family protein
MKKQKILSAITLLYILFIFSNSIYSGESSGYQSKVVMQIINDFLYKTGININLTEFFIRKLAHFTEYFILGNLLTVTIKAYVSRIRECVFLELFLLLLVPVIDEFIQTFSLGRSGNAGDIILDFCGALCGMLIIYFTMRVSTARRQLKNR